MNNAQINKRPCKPMLKINEEVKNIELQKFLKREDVKAIIADVKLKLHQLVNNKNNGFDNGEASQFEQCLEALNTVLKQTLKDKVKEANIAYFSAERITVENAKELDKEIDKEIDKFEDVFKNE
ncbi:MAG: hypothetical protein PHC46_03840 [Clostridia bacterium]|nr:hypothetical protein [Clostridia bacterium]